MSCSRPSLFWIGFALILTLASLTRFSQLGAFSYPVFDEAYYATFASQYAGSVNFLEAHPPTAKIIYGLAAKLAGASGEERFSLEGNAEPYGVFPYLPLRATAAAAGVLVIAALMFLTREIASPAAALIAGSLATFDNALLVESRYILLNIFILLFGITGLWCFMRSGKSARGRRVPQYGWLAAASILLGLAISVKLTGAVFLGVMWFAAEVKKTPYRFTAPQLLAFVFLIPAAVFLSSFFIHFALFPAEGEVLTFAERPPVAMIEHIREKLPDRIPGTFADRAAVRAVEVGIAALATLSVHAEKLTHHPYASPWYSWPFSWKGVLFVSEQTGSDTVRVVWLGNPLVWWGGLLALLATLWGRLRRRISGAVDPLIFGYALSLAPLAFSPRELFIYLYLPALVFIIMLAAMLLDRIAAQKPMLAGIALIAVILAFFFFAPLSYGWPLSPWELRLRGWLPEWRIL